MVYRNHPNESKDYMNFFLKTRTTENETLYKYKYFIWKKIKKKIKTSYYQRKLKIFEGDIKTWKIIKKVIGKKRGRCDSFPKNNNWQSRNHWDENYC